MNHAFEHEEEYRNGKRVKKVTRVGPVVPWAFVSIVAILMKQALPANFWQLFKW